MAINKNFVVRHGLEVNSDLILANANTRKVGIASASPKYTLDVRGGIGATDLYLSGISTVIEKFNVGIDGITLTAIGSSFVGVGTAFPAYLLDVRSPVSSGQTALYVQGDVKVTGDLNIDDIVIDSASISTLVVSGLSTFTSGPVLVGSDTSTGNSSTVLQVAGINSSVYVGGNIGIGSTNPTSQLYVNGSVYITGISTFTNYAKFVDSVSLYFGDGLDLNIYHDGSNSYIQEQGQGNLYIQSNNGSINLRTNSTENAVVANQDGSVELYYDNTKKLETLGVGATITGTLFANELNVSDVATLGFITARNLYVAGVGTFLSSGLKIRNPANTFEYILAGDAIGDNYTVTLPVVTGNTGIALTGVSNTFSAAQTFSSTLTASSTLTLSGSATGTHVFGSNQTTGTLTFGGSSGTGLITFGRSTATQTTNIQSGASGVGTTKTINLGTGGLSGSFTQINIGPGPNTGVGTVVINSGNNLLVGTTTSTGTASQALQVNSGAYVSGNLGVGNTNPLSKLFVTQSSSSYSSGESSPHAIALSSGNNGRTMWMGYDDTIDAGYINVAKTGQSRPIYLQTRNLTNTTTVFVGIGTTQGTGTVNQYLQVGGGAYVSDNVGIGTTNPTSKLSVVGDGNFSGVITATSFSGSGVNLTGIVTSIVAGTNVTISGSTGQVTINATGGGGSGTNYWEQTAAGINTLSNVGIGTTNPGEKLQVDGNLRLGISTTSNYIAFRGTTGDNPGGYNHTYIGERIWSTGTEKSELLLFKGNDYDTTSGPDRIRFAAGQIRIDTYTTPTFGTFESIATNVNLTNRVVVHATGEVGIGTDVLTGTASQPLQVTGGAYVSGNLGIGTTNPGVKLDVSGDIRLSSTDPEIEFNNGGPRLKVPAANTLTIHTGGGLNSTANEAIRINTAGVGIGTTNPTSNLHVIGNALITGIITSTDYNSTSDINLKTDIVKIENPLEKLNQLNGVNFTWKATNKKSLGVIAQEVEAVLPELVSGDDPKTVNYNGLIGLLIECVKEQQKEIDDLKQRLNK